MKIMIINGSYGADNGRGGVKVINRGQTCEVDEAEAKRLVLLGVAVIDTDSPLPPAETGAPAADSSGAGNDTPDAETPAGAQETGESGKYAGMKVAELRALMKERGLSMRVGMTKVDMAAALIASEQTSGDGELPPDPEDEEQPINDGELPPVLAAEDPGV